MISVEPIVILNIKQDKFYKLYFISGLPFCVNHAIIACQVDIVNLVLGIDANALTCPLNQYRTTILLDSSETRKSIIDCI